MALKKETEKYNFTIEETPLGFWRLTIGTDTTHHEFDLIENEVKSLRDLLFEILNKEVK